MSQWRFLPLGSRVVDLPICTISSGCRTDGGVCSEWRASMPAATTTGRVHKHSQSNIRLTLMRIGALRVPSDESRRYRRAEGLASGAVVPVSVKASQVSVGVEMIRGAGAGVFGCGPGGRRIGAPPPAEKSRGCGAAAALHVTVRRARSSRRGHRLSVASPSYCLADGGARCTAPLHSADPPAAAFPLAPSPRRAHPPRPEEFSASGGKNRLCSEPRIISARRTAPLRPPTTDRARRHRDLLAAPRQPAIRRDDDDARRRRSSAPFTTELLDCISTLGITET